MSEITAQDISDYVATQDDFDLELFVYRELLKHGISSSHGGTYVDPYTGKARQFDIRASIQLNRLGWGLNFAIECKSLSTEFPLIVSCVPRPEFESTHYLVHSWGPPHSVEVLQATPGGLRLYPAGVPAGKQTFQLKKEPPPRNFKAGDSESYEKWSQALSSAADLVELARKGHIRYDKGSYFTLVLPILVVSDETLWTIDYDDNGNRADPKRVDECTLFVDREYVLREGVKYTITHLHIYTRRGFLSFLRGLLHPTSLLIERMFAFAVRK